MGWFRPRRTVSDPSGQEWELFVSRITPPSWQPGSSDGLGANPPMSGAGGELVVLELPFALLGFLWSSLVLPVLRFCVRMPSAIVKGRRSQAARIEAMTFYPEPETRTWTTTLDQVERVLEEIALGLEQGRLAQPAGAVYLGSTAG